MIFRSPNFRHSAYIPQEGIY